MFRACPVTSHNSFSWELMSTVASSLIALDLALTTSTWAKLESMVKDRRGGVFDMGSGSSCI